MAYARWIYGVSVGLHIALGVWIGRLESRPRSETISISVSDSDPKKNEKQKPPEPAKVETQEPEAKPKAARAQAKAKAAPAETKPAEAQQTTSSAAMEALPDFGLMLGGGVGPGGLAVPAGNAMAAPASKTEKTEKALPKVLAPAPVDECGEPLVKPKPISVPQPAYTEDARSASIEGRVRVEVSVDAEGHVTKARILSGLGHGLDEAAMASARQASFSPATRCGKAVATTFVIAMRFSL